VSYFALLYEVVDDFVTRRQPYRAEPLSLALAAHARGELVLAGAFAEPADGALLTFHGPDRSAAESFARRDPYVRAGLVNRWTVRRWSVGIGGQSFGPSITSSGGEDPLPVFFERFVAGLSAPWLDKARRSGPCPTCRSESSARIRISASDCETSRRNFREPSAESTTECSPARTRGGRIFALGQGTRLLRLRVGRSRPAEAYRSGAKPDAELGPDWVELDAWNPEPPAAAGLATLRELAALAHATGD
jgi:uncharacterized protein YciI